MALLSALRPTAPRRRPQTIYGVAILAALSCATLAAQPASNAGTVAGAVLNSSTGTPINKATITLSGNNVRLTALSTSTGEFHFTGLPAGAYRLTAARRGFQERPSRQPVLLSTDAHVTGVLIQLRPLGIIMGQVYDEDNDPLDLARVTLWKQTYRDGRRIWERINKVTETNHKGEYQFADLPPAKYLVQVLSLRETAYSQYGAGRETVYLPTYYPNGTTEQEATPVYVKAGSEVRGIDVRAIKVPLPPLVRVKGKVTGLPPDSRAAVSVSLQRLDSMPFLSSTLASPPDYAFEMKAPTGQYMARANMYADGPEAYAATELTLAGDIANLVLALTPAVVIAGRVTIAEEEPDAKLSGVSVRVTPISGEPLFTVEARSDPAGRLVFRRAVPPGRYLVDVDFRTLPDGYFFDKAKLAGQAIPTREVDLLARAQLEIVLGGKAARIVGTVTDADDKPASDATVTLFSVDGTSPPRSQRVAEDAVFQFSALRPGKYKLFAWDNLDESSWQDPDFLKEFEAASQVITVGASETQTTALRLITLP